MYTKADDLTEYHAALYIRLSKEDDTAGPSQSVTNQQSLLEEFASQHRLPVYDTYIDDGWSGTTFDRPAFRRMLRDIEAKKVDLVITKDLSRLGRDYILTGHYMERYFPEHGVRYISLLDGIDTGTDSTANEITPFRAILNDLYAKDISKKIRSVKGDQQRRGLFIGGKPVYGYKMHPTEKNRIVPDPPAAAVVRRIFAMALQGQSCRSIAAQLNALQVPPPSVYAGLPSRNGRFAGLWSSQRISEMLLNETYMGNMVQGRQVKISYKSQKCRKLPAENWVVVENTHEPLVDRETFCQVRLLVNSRKGTRSRTYDYLLKGIVYCHECGARMTVSNRRTSKGADRLFFVCKTYQRFPKAGVCSCHTIKVDTVTEAVVAKVREICRVSLDFRKLLTLAQQALEEAAGQDRTGQQMAEIRQKLQRLSAHLDRIYADRLEGLLSEEDFRRISSRTRAERQQLGLQHEALRRLPTSPENGTCCASELVQDFLETICTSRELLLSLVDRVELDKTRHLEIRFRIAPP